MLLDPQQLCRRPAGLKAHLAGDLIAQLIAELAPQFLCLLACPVIHPHDGIFQRLAIAVQQAERFTLHGKSHHGDIPGADGSLGGNDLHAFLNGLHVNVAGGLYNIGLRRQQGVFHNGRCLLRAGVVKDCRL